MTLQLSTTVADHVIKDSLPDLTCIGSAVISSTGCNTVTSTDDRPPFEQTTVYVVVLRGLIETEPSASPPVLKFTPELLVELTHANDIVTAPPSFIVTLAAPVPVPLEAPPVAPLVPPLETPKDGGGGGGGGGGNKDAIEPPDAKYLRKRLFLKLLHDLFDLKLRIELTSALIEEALKSP